MAATWIGGAEAIAQVETFTVGGTISGETFTISLAHPSGAISAAVAIASVTDSTTSAATNATNLITAFNASNHEYARYITASSGGSGIVTLTAQRPGIPFVSSVNTPGGSATFVKATTTANSGPNDYSVASNWREGIVPVATSDVVLTGRFDILYGLSQASVAIDGFTTTDWSGKIAWPGAPLKIDPDKFQYDSTGGPSYIDIGNAAILCTVIRTGQQDPYGLYLLGSAGTTLKVEPNAKVCLAWNEGETSTFTNVDNAGIYGEGPGATTTNVRSASGFVTIRSNQSKTLLLINGGGGYETGSGARTTIQVDGPGASLDARGTGAITNTKCLNGAMLTFMNNTVGRALGTITASPSSKLELDPVIHTNAGTGITQDGKGALGVPGGRISGGSSGSWLSGNP